MANIKSAQKRVRQTKVRTERNKSIKTRVRSAHRKLAEAITAGDDKVATEAYKGYASAVDKAYKGNLFHRNKAANLKSKAAKSLQSKTA